VLKKNEKLSRKLRTIALVCKHAALVLLLVAAGLFNSVFDAAAAGPCTPAIGLVVSVQGMVEVRRSREKNWQTALLEDALCPGDTVRVRDRSRAAVRFNNETVLQLDQKTALTLNSPAKDEATLLEMMSGAIYVLTGPPRPFKINTRFLNANVGGTEFSIRMDQDQAKLVVHEGKVSASNEQGNLILISNDEVVARRSQVLQKKALLRPLDAIQWALYYPAIINNPLDQQAGNSPPVGSLQASIELYQHGRITEALVTLDDVPESQHSPRFLTYRAGLLLSVGQVGEAGQDIKRAAQFDPGNSNVYALQALISTVQNDNEQAIALAARAVELDSLSPTAWLALSYAQRANSRVEEALDSVKKAVQLDPQNALAWARLAELHMATGYVELALKAAEQAVVLNPHLAKTQTVLGFTYLVQMDITAAKGAFTRAIKRDQADPVPRLGMSLARIREGDLKAGRIELEIAASLDPINSLIRSYLRKAFLKEKRDGLAGTRFDLAKKPDPADLTPWLYDGIMKQTQTQPVEAWRDIQESIERQSRF
jgi:tetratricopeptide (TPR) repeat protein